MVLIPSKKLIFSLLIILALINISCLAEVQQIHYYGISDEGEGVYRILKLEIKNEVPKLISCITDEEIIKNKILIDGQNADDIIREIFYEGSLSYKNANNIKKVFQQYNNVTFSINKSKTKNGKLIFETERNKSNNSTFIKFNGEWGKEKIKGEIIVYKSDKDKYPSYGIVELCLLK